MGFALWHREQLLVCSGTHEYRPMGTAIVSDQDLFSARDFSARRPAPERGRDGFVGYFASLNDVNAFLRSPVEKRRKRNPHRILATLR
jgi:hypothetical protein